MPGLLNLDELAAEGPQPWRPEWNRLYRKEKDAACRAGAIGPGPGHAAETLENAAEHRELKAEARASARAAAEAQAECKALEKATLRAANAMAAGRGLSHLNAALGLRVAQLRGVAPSVGGEQGGARADLSEELAICVQATLRGAIQCDVGAGGGREVPALPHFAPAPPDEGERGVTRNSFPTPFSIWCARVYFSGTR